MTSIQMLSVCVVCHVHLELQNNSLVFRYFTTKNITKNDYFLITVSNTTYTSINNVNVSSGYNKYLLFAVYLLRRTHLFVKPKCTRSRRM